MRFGLKQLLAFSVLAGLTICAVDNYITETVTIKFSTPTVLDKNDSILGDYFVGYEILNQNESMSGIASANYGFMNILGKSINKEKLTELAKYRVKFRRQKNSLPFLPAETIYEKLARNFDELIVFPDTEKWGPMHRLGSAEEIANVVAFLTSDKSSYIIIKLTPMGLLIPARPRFEFLPYRPTAIDNDVCPINVSRRR